MPAEILLHRKHLPAGVRNPHIGSMTTLSPARTVARNTKPVWLVILLCLLIVVLEGFMGSLVFVGALFGALGAGAIADGLGRKKTILGAGLAALMLLITLLLSRPTSEKAGAPGLAH